MSIRKIGLVFGGKSPEHEVSIISARNIFNAIDKEKFEITLIGIAQDGKWYLEQEGNLQDKNCIIGKTGVQLAVVFGNVEKEWDFFIGKAGYIKNPGDFIWKRVLESARASDSVLSIERELTNKFPSDQKYSFEDRKGITVRQYSTAFSIAFNNRMDGMIERRMRQSIYAIASFWYTAWVNAGQPDLKDLATKKFTAADLKDFESLNEQWKAGSKMIGREEN